VVHLVRIDVPDNLRSCAGYNPIGRAHRVGVPVITHGRHRKGGGGSDDVGRIPAKGYQFPGGDFEERGGGLLGLCDGKDASWCSVGYVDEAEAR